MRIPLRAVAGTLALVVALASPASADTLWTSALSIDGGNDLQCRITNVTGRTQRVRAESLREDGSVVSDSGDIRLRGQGSAVLTNDDSSTGAIVCKFTVGARESVRASAQNTEGPRGAIAVAPAR